MNNQQQIAMGEYAKDLEKRVLNLNHKVENYRAICAALFACIIILIYSK